MKTITHEKIYLHGDRTTADVVVRLPHFLEYGSNNEQLHSALNYRSPKAFEAEHALTLLSGQITIP